MLLRRLCVIVLLFFLLVPAGYAQSQNVKTGSFTLSGSVKSILGEEAAASYENLIDTDLQITWEIDVPENYNPAMPPGVMVYVSPTKRIILPTGWLDVTRNKNLIFIAARESGNRVLVNNRIVMSVLSLPLIQSKYNINTKRIYISGFSGGGRVASMVSTKFPHIFDGALYNCGVNFWEQINDQQIKLIKSHHYVFLTGTQDFNLQDTKNVYAKYKKAGVKNIKLMVVPRMGHANPSKNYYNRAISFLDKGKS